MTLYYSICLQTAACATGLPPSSFPFNTLAHKILRTSHLGNLYSVTYTYLPYLPNPHLNLALALTTDLQISVFQIKTQLLSPINCLESDVCSQNWHKSDHTHSLVFPSAFSPQWVKLMKLYIYSTVWNTHRLYSCANIHTTGHSAVCDPATSQSLM